MPVKTDIIQNLILAGEEDVISGLGAIASAGEQAFSAIARAATATDFESVTAGIIGIGAAFATAVGGVAKWADVSARAAVDLERLGSATGSSVSQIGTLSTALTRASGDADNLAARFRTMAQRVESAWGVIQHEWRTAAEEAATDKEKIVQAQNTAIEARVRAAGEEQEIAIQTRQNWLNVASAHVDVMEASSKAALQEKQDAVTVEGAYLNLVDAYVKYNEYHRQFNAQPADAKQLERAGFNAREIGEMRVKNQLEEAQVRYEASIQKQREDAERSRISLMQTRLQYESAIKKARDDEELASARISQANTQRNLADIQIRQAKTKDTEDQANNIKNLEKYFEEVSQGITQHSQKVNLTTDNIVKGVIASVGHGAAALKEFSGDIGEIGLRAPQLLPVMYKVADIFKHTEDETLKMSLAVALFGRGVSTQLVRSLSEGSEALKKTQDELKAAGLYLTDFNEKGKESDEFIGTQFLKTLTRLSTDVQIVGAKFGLQFGPTFTAVMTSVANLLEANKDKILEWGRGLVYAVNPVVAAFAKFVLGIDLVKELHLDPDQIFSASEWLQRLEDIKAGFVNWGAALGAVWEGIKVGFNAVMKLLDYLAEGINKVLGTNINGKELGITLLIGQLTGLNNLAILVAGNLLKIGAAAAVFLFMQGPIGMAALALMGLVAVAFLFKDEIAAAFKYVSTAIEAYIVNPVKIAIEMFKALKEASTLNFNGPNGASEHMKKAFDLTAANVALKKQLSDMKVFGEKSAEGIGTKFTNTVQEIRKQWEALAKNDKPKIASEEDLNKALEKIQKVGDVAAQAKEKVEETKAAVGAPKTAEQRTITDEVRGTPMEKYFRKAPGSAKEVKDLPGADVNTEEYKTAKGRFIGDIFKQPPGTKPFWKRETLSTPKAAEPEGPPMPEAPQVVTPPKKPQEPFKSDQILDPFKKVADNALWGQLETNAATAATAVSQSLMRAADQSAAQFQNAFRQLVAAAESAWDQIKATMQADMTQMTGATGSGGKGGENVGHAATGGKVVGKEGDDVNPYMLTKDEWVIQKGATQKYGHAMMDAINNMRIAPEALYSALRASSGGIGKSPPITSELRPANIGSSGAASPGRPVALTFGGETFQLHGASSEVSSLERHAVLKQAVRAAKRAPRRIS